MRRSGNAVRGTLFELRYAKMGRPAARLGLIIAKRFARTAVMRNVIKRLSREAFRLLSANLPPYDVVIRLKTRIPQPIRVADRPVLRQEICSLLLKLPK